MAIYTITINGQARFYPLSGALITHDSLNNARFAAVNMGCPNGIPKIELLTKAFMKRHGLVHQGECLDPDESIDNRPIVKA